MLVEDTSHWYLEALSVGYFEEAYQFQNHSAYIQEI